MKTVRLLILAALLCSACTPADSRAEPPAASARSQQTQGAAMQLTINHRSFTADLADTAAAQELRRLLPLTLTLQDHLGNEKHAPLPHSLPRNDYRPGRIEAGDVMLWQGDTIVVFYESFDSAYSYTRLGKIRDIEGLKQAVGKGAVSIRFATE
ncbi:MAG: cyclophilin-like fold protein [Neisseria sp.]|uniref:cyclophilin-like fold protein n=1 Tax=Neisseria sp. TaxID=192066 RepID=UPI0026DB6A4E|nr:cyclophilin-like fold protein [Neisseria sp.]MDO4247834.1 cyclophilin-like fold protein [Neisseria sp.]